MNSFKKTKASYLKQADAVLSNQMVWIWLVVRHQINFWSSSAFADKGLERNRWRLTAFRVAAPLPRCVVLEWGCKLEALNSVGERNPWKSSQSNVLFFKLSHGGSEVRF